jgi:hypothetical protein
VVSNPGKVLFKDLGAGSKPEITAAGAVRVVKARPPVDEAGAAEVVLGEVAEVAAAEVAVNDIPTGASVLGTAPYMICERRPWTITR